MLGKAGKIVPLSWVCVVPFWYAVLLVLLFRHLGWQEELAELIGDTKLKNVADFHTLPGQSSKECEGADVSTNEEVKESIPELKESTEATRNEASQLSKPTAADGSSTGISKTSPDGCEDSDEAGDKGASSDS